MAFDPFRNCQEKGTKWVIQNCAFSLRAFEIGGSGSSEGDPSARQLMSSVCQRFSTISTEIPSRENVLRRPSIVAITEEGGQSFPRTHDRMGLFGVPRLREFGWASEKSLTLRSPLSTEVGKSFCFKGMAVVFPEKTKHHRHKGSRWQYFLSGDVCKIPKIPENHIYH